MTTATIGHASKPKSKRASSLQAENLSSFWFLLPIIIIFFILTVVPLAQSLLYSLIDYDGYSENFSFAAFSNYVTIFRDPSLLSALGPTLLYAFGTTLSITCFAIPLAVTLNKTMRGCSFTRSLFLFLGVSVQAVIGLIWQYIFSPLGSGVMNRVIAVFGIPNIPWLADDSWARFCVIFVVVWMQTGWHATLYLAYLQTIPADLYEQARVDGVNSRQQFFHTTLPQLILDIVVSMFLLMTGGLKIHDLPYTSTGGGPGYVTNTLSQAIILRGIGQNQYGLGSALSVCFTIACILVIAVQTGIANAMEKRFQ